MTEYHKIHTIWKRDEKGRILEGQYSLPEFEYLADTKWLFTEKVNGTNIRVSGTRHGNIGFRGKTDKSQIPGPLLNKLMELFPIGKLTEVFCNGPECESFCLYGEGYGAKIQKGGDNYNPTGCDFVLFDIKIGAWWLKREAVAGIADQLGICVVPVVGEGSLSECCEVVRHGLRSQWGDFPAEGIVARPAVDLFNRKGERIITKIKHRDYITLSNSAREVEVCRAKARRTAVQPGETGIVK